MEAVFELDKPATLDEGKYYERRQWNPRKEDWDIDKVQLIAFSNCPAFVIVRDGYGRIYQCQRKELYLQPEEAS